MFELLKSRAYSIGVDIGNDGVRLIQLAKIGKHIKLVAGRNEERPEDIEPGSSSWQRWAIETIRRLTADGDFQGKEVIAALPANKVFIEQIRMPKANNGELNGELEDAAFSKIKQKLPFKASKDNTMIQCIRTCDDYVLVIAAERKIIDRHLAIYEEANLRIKSIGVWPVALTNCYTSFFGRRQSDIKAVVMLICIEVDCTNVVICRHKNILFARSILMGAKQLDDEKVVSRLALELTACRQQFSSLHRSVQMERVIFLSGQAVDRDICAAIAKQLEMPAQMGDCLVAVQISSPCPSGIDRRVGGSAGMIETQKRQQAPRALGGVNWAMAFGLSLS